MLRIKVFVDKLRKITQIIYNITQTVNRASFMTLSNTECSETLVKQINAKLNML